MCLTLELTTAESQRDLGKSNLYYLRLKMIYSGHSRREINCLAPHSGIPSVGRWAISLKEKKNAKKANDKHIKHHLAAHQASQVAPVVKKRHERCGFDPLVGKIPWRRVWQPAPVFLPGESHGQRSLEGCSPWGHKELDT